jgi:hypothetical protein
MNPPDGKITKAAVMDREGLIRAIGTLRFDFPNDLSPQYLRTLSDDKLRHLYLALCLHVRVKTTPKPKSPTRRGQGEASGSGWASQHGHRPNSVRLAMPPSRGDEANR